MMDGRVGAIRERLDLAGFTHIPIMAYAVKFASAFYAPFREAAESAPEFGDRAGYQMDPANLTEALKEAETDLQEGADMLLVKPSLGYGDVVRRLADRFSCPVGSYAVSGEYSMIKAASRQNWVDERKIVIETHLGMKRAGARFIVTYWSKDLARWKAV
jgi:porphobilinogen synthase